MGRTRRPRPGGRRVRAALLLLALGMALPLLLRPRPTPLPARVAEAALSQVGKVGYFWGGKSVRLGPDPRWGMLKRVTSAGSGSTGTLRPYGLDCSGLVSWAAATAAGDSGAGSAIGEGTKTQYANATPIPWARAKPGDLVFFPDLSHVGIAVGWGEGGKLRVVHASSTLGGVVLSEDAALIGFTEVRRPGVYKSFPAPSE